MRSTSRGRLRSVAMVSALVAATLTVVAPSASALPGPVVTATTDMVSSDALPTVQIDGVVWQQAIVGNTVYAGGSFGNARPAGASPGTNQVARSNLLAYDITTGQLISSFAPSINGQIRAVTASPDGSRIYVGGDFRTVNGVTKTRIAAFSTATGQLITSFDANLDATVRTIVATNTTVYVGGVFSASRGTARSRLAAFSASTGALLGWAPSANSGVYSMTLTPDGSKVIVGGAFSSINGATSAYGMAALDPVNGAVLPWAATTSIRNSGTNSAILSLTTDGTSVYGSGYRFGSGGNLEGAFRLDPSNGAVQWIEDCHGDTYDTAVANGIVYTVSHAHFCGNIGGFYQTDPWATNQRHALAFTTAATGTIDHEKLGYFDWYGYNSPSLYNWFPDMTNGSYTGQTQAAWDVTANSDYVVLGGEFPTVNGKGQQGLVRFAKRSTSAAPKVDGPRVTGAAFAPRLLSINASSVRVSWQTNWDRDDLTLTYRVIRDNNTVSPVYETTTDSTFWNRPSLSFLDTGVPPGAHNYRIEVRDSNNNLVTGSPVSITPASGVLSAYVQRVVQDGAGIYWRLSEASGSTAVDSAGFTDAAIANVTRGAAGAIVDDADTATTFTGASGSTLGTTVPVAGPNTFTAEAWFKTSTTSGGKIIGFGNQPVTESTSYDRQIYMDNQGRIWFGVNNGSARTLNSSASYNNGAWHHAVASLGSNGMNLYVDGVRVGSRSDVTSGQYFQGYWRVGGDNLNNWTGKPTSNYFNGSIDEVAVYPSVLAPTAVTQHYQLGTVAAANQAPTAAFTAKPTDLLISVDGTGSTDADGSIAAYSWNWGDGTPAGSGATATHTYATGGAYTVTLTVTDDDNATDTETVVVTVTAPTPNVDPDASFTVSSNLLDVSVDGSGSTDSDGSIASYSWNWGDGTAAGSGAAATHHYGAPGTYSIALTVTDNRGGADTAASSVTVTGPPNQAPTAAFSSTVSGLGVAVNGSGSTDADGTIASFTWNWGDGTAAGSSATTNHTYAAAGTYTVTLTVLDDDGAPGTLSRDVTVSGAAAADTFGRTVANGWGNADVGGAWTLTGGSNKFAVTNGVGTVQLSTAGSGPTASLAGLSLQDLDGTLDFAVDKPATGGGVYTNVAVRKIGTSSYQFTLKFLAGGAVTVSVARILNGTATSLGTVTVPDLTFNVGDLIRFRFQAIGSGTTTLQAKAWKVGSAEPAAFQLTRTDTSTALQAPGSLTLQPYLSSSVTNAPLVATLDNLALFRP